MAYDENEIFPVFAGRILIRGNKMTCIAGDEQFVAHAPAQVLEHLFVLCNGQQSIGALVETLARKWRKSDVSGLVQGLLKAGVLVDALDIGATVWSRLRATQGRSKPEHIAALTRQENARRINPVCDVSLPVSSGALGALLNKRTSATAFSGEEVPLAAIGTMLWCAYGVLGRDMSGAGIYRRTVPSAGGFHPIDLFLILLRPCQNLETGTYRVGYNDAGQVGVSALKTNIDEIPRAFFDPGILVGAQAIVLFAASAGAPARKYGPRAALYASLEAGHAIQNLLLAAGQHDVATREVGGFSERVLRRLLDVPADSEILGSVVFGMPSVTQDAPTHSEIAFQWLDSGECGEQPVLGRASQVVDGKRIVGWGYSTTPALAYAKALGEVVERRACMRPHGIERGKLSDFDGAVDPRSIVAYRAVQYRHPDFPYVPFDCDAAHGWKRGVEVMTGQACHVLAEHVYFPDALAEIGYALYTGANSSGVAAHTSLEDAFENALLECVERDAFMCRWLSRTAPPRIATKTLPGEFAARIRGFSAMATELAVFDLSLDTVPVVMVVAVNRGIGFCTVGTSASPDPQSALSHAFNEVAFRLDEFHRRGRVHSGAITPEEVRTPAQHALLYRQVRYLRRAEFLWSAPESRTFASLARQTGPAHLLDAIDAAGFSPLLFDLSAASEGGADRTLHVARAIVPGLIPMSFGYGVQPLAPVRLAQVRAHLGPTMKRKLIYSPFPHPFA